MAKENYCNYIKPVKTINKKPKDNVSEGIVPELESFADGRYTTFCSINI